MMSKTNSAADSAADGECEVCGAQQPAGESAGAKKQGAKRKTQVPDNGNANDTSGGAGDTIENENNEAPELQAGGETDPRIASEEQEKENSGSESALAAERDRYLRLAAEYDNYRKRSTKERETVYNDARTDTITRLLPVYDNLERALKMECADEAFYKGVEMTMTQLTEILNGMNVTQIPAVGEPFDPNRHNAVMSVEDPGLGEKIIAEECRKGFMLGDKVIRFSTVVVAN